MSSAKSNDSIESELFVYEEIVEFKFNYISPRFVGINDTPKGKILPILGTYSFLMNLDFMPDNVSENIIIFSGKGIVENGYLNEKSYRLLGRKYPKTGKGINLGEGNCFSRIIKEHNGKKTFLLLNSRRSDYFEERDYRCILYLISFMLDIDDESMFRMSSREIIFRSIKELELKNTAQ